MLRGRNHDTPAPDATMVYGRELLTIGEAFAKANGLDPLNCVASAEDVEGESPRYRADIVLSAGRWCVFWGERGHMLDAYW